VTSENGGTVSVVDTAKHKVVKTIKLAGESVRPMGVVVSPDGKRVFVSTGRGGSVMVIDTRTNASTGSVKVGDRPWGIGISPDGKLLYTANGPSNDVSVVDTETLTVLGTIKAGQRPWGIAVAPAPPAR
jgi:YVTN family beta-propeller protein